MLIDSARGTANMAFTGQGSRCLARGDVVEVEERGVGWIDRQARCYKYDDGSINKFEGTDRA